MDQFVSFFVVRIFGLFVLPGNLVLVIVMPFSKVVRVRYYCNFKTLYSINEAPDGHDDFGHMHAIMHHVYLNYTMLLGEKSELGYW